MKNVQVTYTCDLCNKSSIAPTDNMLPEKWVLLSVPPNGFRHVCRECVYKIIYFACPPTKDCRGTEDGGYIGQAIPEFASELSAALEKHAQHEPDPPKPMQHKYKKI